MINLAIFLNSMATMMMTRLLLNDVAHSILEDNPNTQKRRELVDLYGKWAVGRATAACPREDYNCVERESSRLAATVRMKH